MEEQYINLENIPIDSSSDEDSSDEVEWETWKCEICKENQNHPLEGDEKYECFKCGRENICARCIKSVSDNDDYICKECVKELRENGIGGGKCWSCEDIMLDMDEEILVIIDKHLKRGWNFKHNSAGDNIYAWIEPNYVCERCYLDMFSEGHLEECDECEDKYVVEYCDMGINENGLCNHCYYQQRKLAMMTLEKVRKLPVNVNRYIVNML